MIWISDGWVGITVSSIQRQSITSVLLGRYQEMGYKIVQFGETKVIGVGCTLKYIDVYLILVSSSSDAQGNKVF